jgi:NAD(P)-dependent dehydrogenase (short-subunit alcohol dehydrogenase family)
MPPNVAVIAGSSQGIGLHLAKKYLASTSLQVYALSRHPAEARKAILEGVDAKDAGDRLKTLEFDALREESLAQAASEVTSKHGDGCLRLLLNVSGVLHPEKALGQIDAEKSLESFR